MAVDDFETVLYIPGGEYETGLYIPGGEYETVLSAALIN